MTFPQIPRVWLFPQHRNCSFGFWKSRLIIAKGDEAESEDDNSMGQFGRITSLADFPKDRVLIGYLKEAVRLNEEGIKLPAKPKSKEKKELTVPDYVLSALKKNKGAQATFQDFSYR